MTKKVFACTDKGELVTVLVADYPVCDWRTLQYPPVYTTKSSENMLIAVHKPELATEYVISPKISKTIQTKPSLFKRFINLFRRTK
jgi:hypothetical protein